MTFRTCFICLILASISPVCAAEEAAIKTTPQQPSQTLLTATLHELKLTASDAVGRDHFGLGVAVNGNLAMVGARGQDELRSGAGAVYAFRWDGQAWIETQKLLPSDAVFTFGFGNSISIHGNRVLIGAKGSDPNATAGAGLAYIFEYIDNQWVEQQRLVASDPSHDVSFGHAISLLGDRALIGAPGADDGGNMSGAVYVFDYDGIRWIEKQKIIASDAARFGRFGVDVSLNQDRFLVGASGGSPGDELGTAYVFEFDGVNWVEVERLNGSGVVQSGFGFSVSLDGDRALVGHPFDDAAGVVYAFEYDGMGWTEQQMLTSANGQTDDHFGIDVEFSGIHALIGADGKDGGAVDSGAAYLFAHNGLQWVEQTEINANEPAAAVEFGVRVSLGHDRVMVGAPNDSELGLFTGAAHTFTFECGIDAIFCADFNGLDQ